MQQISESHRQLLVTMLNYEIMNYLDPLIDRAHSNYMGREANKLEGIRDYMKQRIKDLAA